METTLPVEKTPQFDKEMDLSNELLPELRPDYEEGLKASPQLMGSVQIANLIGVIKHLQEKLATLDSQRADADEFYQKRAERIMSNIDFLSGKIRAFLEYHNTRSLTTHRGTAYIRHSVTLKSPPERESELIQWAEEHCPSVIITRRSVSRTQLKKYIEANKLSPPFVQIEEHDQLTFRFVGQHEPAVQTEKVVQAL